MPPRNPHRRPPAVELNPPDRDGPPMIVAGGRRYPNLAEYTLAMAAAAVKAAETELFLAARNAKLDGLSAARIAEVAGMSRATLWRRMKDIGYW